MFKQFLSPALLAGAALALNGCSTTVAVRAPLPPPPPGVIVYTNRSAPPPPIVEEYGPRAGYVWVRGHYRWDGHRYVWIRGHYRAV